jgi:hypothetical protein
LRPFEARSIAIRQSAKLGGAGTGANVPKIGKNISKSRMQRASPRRSGASGPSSTRPPPSRSGSSGPAAKRKGQATADGKRRLGLRGAAPWAARHAAKHAEEARARNAEPPRPGSARATLRTPSEAEQIKVKIGELHKALGKVRALRKNLNNGFYGLGEELRSIQDKKLYEAKGYSSFEAFVEREIDLGKNTSLKLTRIPGIFQKDAALEIGMDALFRAIDALDDATNPPSPARSSPGASPRPLLPLKPPKSG